MSEPRHDPRDAKIAVRGAVLAARRSMSAVVRAAADRAITSALVDAAQRATIRGAFPVVAAYAPIGGEPGGPLLLPALGSAVRRAGGRLLLPVLREDRDLDWAAYNSASTLRAARHGLSEPGGPRLGVTAGAQADLLIVPAVAVDHRGVRLGRGGGSYDRLLARVGPDTLVVAVLYAGELLEVVPAESHDRRVGAVVEGPREPGGTASWRTLPM